MKFYFKTDTSNRILKGTFKPCDYYMRVPFFCFLEIEGYSFYEKEKRWIKEGSPELKSLKSYSSCKSGKTPASFKAFRRYIAKLNLPKGTVARLSGRCPNVGITCVI